MALRTGRTIYGVFRIHDAQESFIVARWTDAMPEDIVVIDAAQYRIKRISYISTAPEKSLELQRVDKPIVPVTEATTS